MQALTRVYDALGEANPLVEWQRRRRERGLPEIPPDRVTTLIDVGDFLSVRRVALLAHRTQVDPLGVSLRLSDDALRGAFRWDEYDLARSLVDTDLPEGELERAVRRDLLALGAGIDQKCSENAPATACRRPAEPA